MHNTTATSRRLLTRTISLIIGLAFLIAPSQSASALTSSQAYVEPSLLSRSTGNISVIVTAKSSQVAARAVAYIDGRMTSDLWLIHAVAAEIPTNQLGALAAYPGVESIVDNKGVRSSGAPAAMTGPSSRVTNLAWPVAIDIGADQLHAQGIKGAKVTVAVVDSGVFFSPELLMTTTQQDLLMFVGQADFVNNGICDKVGKIALGIQRNDHCFELFFHSRDGFGHGSHVAGIIGNVYRDMNTGVSLGIAPEASILSVRVLGNDGVGTYEDVIQGIQYVVAYKSLFNIRVMNLSLSASATTPYFVDPLNRAVEQAWAAGVTVVAAAGNEGGSAERITVPGNDPYVITVGAIDTRCTAGVWSDDTLPAWSSTGPTLDGFAKPDVLAPGGSIVSFMFNNTNDLTSTAKLALLHPQYSATTSLFRMSGTSMATAVASGVVALMLQQQPNLTPDQVKYRLKRTARPAIDPNGNLVYSPLQQGNGFIWAPNAVLDAVDPSARDNATLDIASDLAHGYATPADLAFHYQGPVRKLQSDQSTAYLYYTTDATGKILALGSVRSDTLTWLDRTTMNKMGLTWNGGQLAWPKKTTTSTGGFAWNGGGFAWNGGGFAWNGGGFAWNGGGQGYTWSGGGFAWNGGGFAWNGGGFAWNGGGTSWTTGVTKSSTVSTTRWVESP